MGPRVLLLFIIGDILGTGVYALIVMWPPKSVAQLGFRFCWLS